MIAAYCFAISLVVYNRILVSILSFLGFDAATDCQEHDCYKSKSSKYNSKYLSSIQLKLDFSAIRCVHIDCQSNLIFVIIKGGHEVPHECVSQDEHTLGV